MDFKLLYGEKCDVKKQEKRFDYVAEVFEKNEKAKPQYFFSSSGRAEILGNHTDHNHGKVMVAAISCDIVAAVGKRDDGIVKICSIGYPALTVDINKTEVNPEEYGTSLALTKGICNKLKEMGFTFGGFTAHTDSNIFKGAGVSSSAAFEVLVCEIINKLYLNEQLDEVTKAVISQYAENVYFGKPCGLLDQSGISIGSLTKLDFNVPEKPIIKKMVPPKGYTLVITNTGGNHAALTKHYADIRIEMEEVASFFGKKVLRDVSYDEFMDNMDKLKAKFNGRAILRALHFFNENKRVDEAEKALEQGDAKAFLDAVNGSGLSSLTLLQNCCVPGDTDQPVVVGIELSRQIIKDGAVRVHGGGFAGSIIAWVSNAECDSYAEYMRKVFGKENVFIADIRMVGTTFVK